MRRRLVVDVASGRVQLVPFTVDEETARDADDAAAAAAAAAQATLDGNAATIQGRALAALANLENAAANWGTLTAAQKDNATLLAVRVCARLIRLQLRQLDSSGQ